MKGGIIIQGIELMYTKIEDDLQGLHTNMLNTALDIFTLILISIVVWVGFHIIPIVVPLVKAFFTNLRER